MGAFTQQQFLDAVEREGMRDQFSDADWYYSMLDPEYGMTTLSNKIDYRDAKTDEERALANQNQENNRMTKGYAGGTDGSKYYQLNTPSAYEYQSAPSFADEWGQETKDTYNSVKNYGDFTYDPYTSQWGSQIQDMGNQLYNYGPFEYSASTDPLYAQYRKEYAREGRRATEDTLGIAAAASGGLPSSYAATAAAQAGNYYASQLTDKIPELYKLAYQKYLSDYQLKSSTLSALQSLDQSDYTKWLNGVNLNRDIYNDKYGRLVDAAQMAQNLSNTEWSRYQDNVAQHNTEQNFLYGQHMDQIDYERTARQDALDKAEIAYQKGDNSFYNALGIDTANDPAARERAWAEAERAANYNDYSWLENMGVDTSNAPGIAAYQNQLLATALDVYETTGEASKLKELGIDPNYTDLNKLAKAQRGELEENGGLTAEEVMQIQWYMGITMDGYWGPESMTAANGMTAREAYDAMKAGTLPRGTGGGYYGGGYDDGDYYGGSPSPSPSPSPDKGGLTDDDDDDDDTAVDWTNPDAYRETATDMNSGITRSEVAEIKGTYGTAITSSQLKAIESAYGVTEEDLNANGIYVRQGSGTSSSSTKSAGTNSVNKRKKETR